MKLFGISGLMSDDIAIDLGTANTLIHVANRGIVIDEPSVVAVSTRGGMREIVAVGDKAKQMLGRTPEAMETISPMRDGVIADFVATDEMLRYFIKQTKSITGLRRPRILICVPAAATPVERRAIYETALSAGAREVFLVEEPVAAAIGAGLPIDDARGAMVIDIGGGTTDSAVMSLGGVVQARSLRSAGHAMDEAIARYVRRNHHLVIGLQNAERIKIEAGSATQGDPEETGEGAEIYIRGRDLKEGRAKTVTLGPNDIAAALVQPITEIAEFIQRAIEDLPPELANDVCEQGVHLTGGGAKLAHLDAELARRLGIDIHMPESPDHCVILGSARIFETLIEREHLLIKP